jgi:hypothetical protein
MLTARAYFDSGPARDDYTERAAAIRKARLSYGWPI